MGPPPHHYILGSISIFKHDDLFALKHSCVGPLHHTTTCISLVQLQHLRVITFVHLNICAFSSPHLKSAKNPSKQAHTFMRNPNSTAQATVRITKYFENSHQSRNHQVSAFFKVTIFWDLILGRCLIQRQLNRYEPAWKVTTFFYNSVSEVTGDDFDCWRGELLARGKL